MSDKRTNSGNDPVKSKARSEYNNDEEYVNVDETGHQNTSNTRSDDETETEEDEAGKLTTDETDLLHTRGSLLYSNNSSPDKNNNSSSSLSSVTAPSSFNSRFYYTNNNNNNNKQSSNRHHRAAASPDAANYFQILRLIPNDVVMAYVAKQASINHFRHHHHHHHQHHHRNQSKKHPNQPSINYIQRMPPMSEIESVYGLVPAAKDTTRESVGASSKKATYKNKRKKCEISTSCHNHHHITSSTSSVIRSRPASPTSSTESLSSSVNTTVDTTQSQQAAATMKRPIKHSSPKSVKTSVGIITRVVQSDTRQRLTKTLSRAVDEMCSSGASDTAETHFLSSLFQLVQFFNESRSEKSGGEFERASKDLMVSDQEF
jgi:hypothetical protein